MRTTAFVIAFLFLPLASLEAQTTAGRRAGPADPPRDTRRADESRVAELTLKAPPRTPWGDPDLQGVWTGSTLTPLERPAALARCVTETTAERPQRNGAEPA